MQISIQKLPKSQVELKIELAPEEFQPFYDKAVSSLGSELKMEGFRQGKAPKEMIEQKVGEQQILQKAAEDCIREKYLQALKEKKIEPFGQPKIEILKMAPGNAFEFKATLSVLPEIELPDYKKIASQVEKKKIEVTPEEIEQLRQQKENVEKEKRRQEMIDKISEKVKAEIPEVLIETEKKRILENFKYQVPKTLQIKFEDYLKQAGKTEEELKESFAGEAEKRVKNFLVLKNIEKKEGVEASDQEVEKEMENVSRIYPNLDENQKKEYAREIIKNEKTLAKLESRGEEK